MIRSINNNTPMKIGIQTWGSNGDIRPMIALADGFQKAEYTVTLAVTSLDNRSYAEECKKRGLKKGAKKGTDLFYHYVTTFSRF